MSKTFRATEAGYLNRLIAEGETFTADDDFKASWAERVGADADDEHVASQEDLPAAIAPVLPQVRADGPDLPIFHPTVETVAETHDKVELALDAASTGTRDDAEVISTARNPSADPAKPAKPAAKASDKPAAKAKPEGSDLV
jgi:hypothetical protein